MHPTSRNDTSFAAQDQVPTHRFSDPWMICDATIIDGTGAPPYGPAHLVIHDGTIIDIIEPGATIDESSPTTTADIPASRRIDAGGKYVLPGLIDSHAHIGNPHQVENAAYVYDLWLGHGITTVRELGSLGNGIDFTLKEAARSDHGDIAAPSIIPFSTFGQGSPRISTPAQAQAWVQQTADKGVAGVKFFGAPPAIFEAALRECSALGLESACHHAQRDAARTNALTTARWGLGSIEHSYGQAEVMYTDRILPTLPPDHNYSNEQERFAEAGHLWAQTSGPGSAAWEDFLDELIDLETTLVPTFAVYNPTRDLMAARTQEWHSQYTSARLSEHFAPSENSHGSFFFDWGTEEEVAWNENYRIWMHFVRDFSLRGGRVCAGSDSGYIYNLYGFGLIQDMELMRHAGFSALEVIRAATLRGAELIGQDQTTGSIEVGKDADLLLIDENPLANLKVLYGNGHYRVRGDGTPDRTSGVSLTIRKGVVHDAGQARQRVKDMVSLQRAHLEHSGRRR